MDYDSTSKQRDRARRIIQVYDGIRITLLILLILFLLIGGNAIL